MGRRQVILISDTKKASAKSEEQGEEEALFDFLLILCQGQLRVIRLVA